MPKRHRKITNQRRSESRRVREYHEAKGRSYRHRNDPAQNTTRVDPESLRPEEDTPRIKRLKVMHPTGPQLRLIAAMEESIGIEAERPETRWDAMQRIEELSVKTGWQRKSNRSVTERHLIAQKRREREKMQAHWPATKKQVNYARHLYEQAGEEAPAWLNRATEKKGGMHGVAVEIDRLKQKLYDQKVERGEA